jgi:hypothetical protein
MNECIVGLLTEVSCHFASRPTSLILLPVKIATDFMRQNVYNSTHCSDSATGNTPSES